MKKITAVWAALLVTAFVIAGCSGAQGEGSAAKQKAVSTEAFPVTIKDAANEKVTIKQAPEKIVSLMPSNTEITYALGLGDKVAGVTTNDTYPKEAVKNRKSEI